MGLHFDDCFCEPLGLVSAIEATAFDLTGDSIEKSGEVEDLKNIINCEEVERVSTIAPGNFPKGRH